MRSIFTLLIALFVSASAFAHNDGMLTITLPSDQFTVIVNGRIYDIVSNTVTIDNIRAGEYRIKIYRYNGNTGNMRQMRDPLYSTFVMVKARYHVDMMINRFGKIYVDEQPLMGSNTERYQGTNKYRRNFAMSAQDFNVLKQRVNAMRFTDEKMILVKEASFRNQFSSSQVVELIKEFSFESDKLEVAKLLYMNTIDKNNFYLVYSEFRFSSTKTELEKYIQEK